jgi:nicotinamide mononucleotide (NMN) deamidase PncC
MFWYFGNYQKPALDTVLCLNEARARILTAIEVTNTIGFDVQQLAGPAAAPEVIMGVAKDSSVMVEVAISIGTGPRGASGQPVGGWIVVTAFSDNDDLAKNVHQYVWSGVQGIIMAE